VNDVRRVQTLGGYVINPATLPALHAIDKTTGVWRTASDHSITTGDILALPLGRMHEETRAVPLPVLDQLYYAGDQQVRVPDELSPELAELVGYFMGDGSLHAKGIRLCVANTDPDVVDRLTISTRELFRIEPSVRQCQGYREVTLQSVRLARWWQAAGFAKALPGSKPRRKGLDSQRARRRARVEQL
jgi:ribonucleoside-diphosphate reductase alpha chain